MWTISKFKILLSVIWVISFLAIGSAWAIYSPPKGIPAPPWGIDTTTPTTTAGVNAWCPNWPTAENSSTHKCYYIDNDSGSCSDANTYGYPNVPRCNLPDLGTLDAGTYIDIRGGTTTPYTHASGRIRGVGTSDLPIVVTGKNAATRPKLNTLIHIGEMSAHVETHYVILENLWFVSGKNIEVRPNSDAAGDHVSFISVRNNYMRGTRADIDNTAIIVGRSDLLGPETTKNIVVYNNDIADYGNSESSAEEDQECVGGGSNITDFWTLNNTCYRTGGDCFGGYHGAHQTSDGIYIGGNTCSYSRESGIDIKQAKNVIISENIIHDLSVPAVNPTGWGQAIIVHSNPDSGYGPDNTWILFNKIYTVSRGVDLSTDWTNAYIIGNVFYDIHCLASAYCTPADNYQFGRAVGGYGLLGRLAIVDNTFYDYDLGIGFGGTAGTVDIHGNIFSTRNTGSSGYGDVYIDDTNTNRNIDYSLFYLPAGNAKIKWYNNTYTSLATFKAGESECANCPAESDPSFVNAPTDFNLRSGSPAKDVSVEGPVGSTAYDAFYSIYSTSIEKDYSGTARPQGSTWDIGAYEYIVTLPAPTEVTPITTPSSDITPTVTINVATGNSGTITYGGSCGTGSLSTAAEGNNNITYTLSTTPQTYSNCTVSVAGSSPLTLTSFTITGPTVAITAPSPGAILGTVGITATCTHADGCAGVTFYRSGTPLDTEDTASPYSYLWDTTLVPNANYTLTAIGRATGGALTTSDPVAVTVQNPVNFGPHRILAKLILGQTISAGGAVPSVTWQGAEATWQGGAVTW